jgi:hypothetical protein
MIQSKVPLTVLQKPLEEIAPCVSSPAIYDDRWKQSNSGSSADKMSTIALQSIVGLIDYFTDKLFNLVIIIAITVAQRIKRLISIFQSLQTPRQDLRILQSKVRSIWNTGRPTPPYYSPAIYRPQKNNRVIAVTQPIRYRQVHSRSIG